MFRVLDLLADGRIEESRELARVAPPAAGITRWIDLHEQTAEDLALLGERFHFHPLALEDCAHFDQLPKLEEFADHLFLVTQGFECGEALVRSLEVHELHSFLGERYLVTVHEKPLAAIDQVWKRATTDAAPLTRGVAFVYYLIADTLVDAGYPILDRITDEIENVEDRVLTRPERSDLTLIFELKRLLVRMRKISSPQRDMMSMLARRGRPGASDDTGLYFRDVYDHLARIVESIETNRDLLGNAMDGYLSAVSNRTNEIMKSLTLLSAVFLPLSFVVGFFGQNFDDLPDLPGWTHSHALMHAMLLICLLTPVVMFLWFKRRGWL